jgi:hypothetical protein
MVNKGFCGLISENFFQPSFPDAANTRIPFGNIVRSPAKPLGYQ